MWTAFPFLSDWVAEDGSLLVGVEIQLHAVPEEIVLQRRFFWAYASASLPCPYNQVALQAVCFLQGIYGFLVFDYNYQGMLAYREVARSTVFIAASIAQVAVSSRFVGTNTVVDVDDVAQWQLLCSRLLSSACNF